MRSFSLESKLILPELILPEKNEPRSVQAMRLIKHGAESDAEGGLQESG